MPTARLSPFGVGVVRITAVNDQIARVEMRDEIGDDRVDDRPSWDEQHDVPRLFEFCEEIAKVIAHGEGHSCTLLQKQIAFLCIKVKSDARDALLGNVKQKVSPHRTQADNSEMCVFHTRECNPKELKR